MRVSTRIVAGYGVLAALTLGALAYQWTLVHRMRTISNDLSLTYFPAASLAIRLDETLLDTEEFVSKDLMVGGYGVELAESRAAFERTLAALEALDPSEAERAALERLRAGWRELADAVESARGAPPPAGYTWLPARLEDRFRRLFSQVDGLHASSAAEVERHLAASAGIDRQATRVSWILAGTALLLSAAVAFPIVRSISGGLGRLMEGTRWLGAGRLGRRIPEDRNDEFGELARSFNRMADRLEGLDRLKKDFVSSVSHELKSPIAASREIVRLLLDEVPGPLNAEQRRLLELSIRSSRRLSSMVGGLLDLARMDAGTITYEMRNEDAAALIRATLEEFAPALEERGLATTLDVADGVKAVRCDRDRIVQVIGNVVDNAMKFAPRGSTIAIRVDPAPPERIAPRGGVEVSVADAGPGIPDAYKERVFGRFQQVRPGGSGHAGGGAGLGLAISRGIVDAHGGRVWVEDNPGGGSVFRLLLPGARKAPPKKIQRAAAVSGAVAAWLALAACGPSAPAPVPPEPDPSIPAGIAFAEGDYETAARAYRRALEVTDPRIAIDREEAFYRLALIHALPDSPLHDAAAARRILEDMRAEFPGASRAVGLGPLLELQAVAADLRSRLDAARAEIGRVASERDAELDALRQALDAAESELETLRAIDRDRRRRD